jgi:hypothetical protein
VTTVDTLLLVLLLVSVAFALAQAQAYLVGIRYRRLLRAYISHYVNCHGYEPSEEELTPGRRLVN